MNQQQQQQPPTAADAGLHPAGQLQMALDIERADATTTTTTLHLQMNPVSAPMSQVPSHQMVSSQSNATNHHQQVSMQQQSYLSANPNVSADHHHQHPRQCQILSLNRMPPPSLQQQQQQQQYHNSPNIYQRQGNFMHQADNQQLQQASNISLYWQPNQIISSFSQQQPTQNNNNNQHSMISPRLKPAEMQLNPGRLINGHHQLTSAVTTMPRQQQTYLVGALRRHLDAPSIINNCTQRATSDDNNDLQLYQMPPMQTMSTSLRLSSCSIIDKCSLLPVQFVGGTQMASNNPSSNMSPRNHKASFLNEPIAASQRVKLVESSLSASSSSASSSHSYSSVGSMTNTKEDNTNKSNNNNNDKANQAKKTPLQTEDGGFRAYLTQLVLASNVPFAYTIILVAFLITIIAATSIITILTIVLTLTGYTAYPITENTFNTSLAIGIVCASFALVLVTGSLIVWRRHCQAAYYYLDEPQDASRGTNSPQLSETYDDSEYGSIPVGDWLKHVQKLHADSDIGFAREFEQIQQANQKQSTALTCDHSHIPENKHKNRYINIVAYDHTRVILRPPLGGQKKPGYDYINANFIDRKCDMYWPKEGTETYGYIQVKLLQEVVMATYTLRTFTVRNLKMKKRAGCDRTVYQYHYTNWPDHGVPDHPLPVLSFVRKSAKANPPGAGAIICHCSAGCGRSGTYIVIDAMLKQIRHKQSINVVDFLKHIRAQRNYLVQTEEQYIFIHDSLVEAIESGETEIPSNLIAKYIQFLQTGGTTGLVENGLTNGATKQLGSNYSLMNGLCQSPLSGGNTLSVAASNNDQHQQQLISTSNSNLLIANGAQKSSLANSQATTVSRSQSGGQWSLLERQYRLVASFKAKDFCVVSALKPCNKNKNRTLNLIPLEAHRVHITPKPGADGSDYINATFLMGFNHLHEFIATQHPVQETFSDFWQMVYDHNSQTIVLLTQMGDEPPSGSSKEFSQFWPQKEDEVDYGSFKVKLIQESTLMKAENGGLIMTRDFIMRSNQDDYELQTRIIHCPGWPECCGPLSAVFDLVQVVQQATQQQASQHQLHDGQQRSGTVTIGQEHEPQNGGPIIVVDKFGGTEAATFAVLTTLFKQINFEDAVDVYMYAKLAHLRRPGIWSSQDDYLFLYRAMENYATSVQQARQQQSSEGKQVTAASLTAPISLANLHHHQTMTLDRHRAHQSKSTPLKSSTMRRTSHNRTANNAAAAAPQLMMISNNSAGSNQQHYTIGAVYQKQQHHQHQQQQAQLMDYNHNTLQYSPASMLQANNTNNSLLHGSSIKPMPKESPYNSAASIGAGSHQHLLAANTNSVVGARPMAVVGSNQAPANQPDHYNLYSIQ